MKTIDRHILHQINSLLIDTQNKISELCGSDVFIQYILVDSNISEKAQEQQVQIILEETARYFNIPLHVLQSPARTKEIAAARFIAFQLLYSTIKLSKARIGKIFNRDHATVISGLRKFNNYYSTEEDFKNDYDTLLTRLNFHHD